MKRAILGIYAPHLFAAAACFILLAIVLSQEGQVNAKASTWSIVAVDPLTGDVGAAGASCVPVNAAALAALIPGKGAAAIQAEFAIENRDRVFELLQDGLSAEEIRQQVAAIDSDPKLSLRQYGIVTLNRGAVHAAGFTGEGNFAWSGDSQDIDLAVSAQGNTLESEDVVRQAMDAYRAEEIGQALMADRLIRALEAGSAAGGDKRCNHDGVQQTALSAFIVVVTFGQEPFAVPLSASTELEGPNSPWLYVSVIEEPGGPNPLLELRHQYDQWRASNLPPCPLCDQFPIMVPPGGANGVEATEQPVSEVPESVEPTSATQESVLSATPQEPEPTEPNGGEQDGLLPGFIVPMLLVMVAIAAAVIVFVFVRRSRQAR
jgi:uncharacterized Ntn-hydrolase superfamily protein